MWIIKAGVMPDTLIGTCEHCHAEVGCTRSEARTEVRGLGSDGDPLTWTVPCPTYGCGGTIDLRDARG